MENKYQGKDYGYGGRPLWQWQWILIYVIIGAVVYGAIYYFVIAKKGGYSSNYSNLKPAPIYEDIKTGKITLDYTQAKELQKSVDEGHQPWRLDPLSVAKAEGLNYGFSSTDVFSLKETASSAGIVKVEATHKGKVYLITLVKPVPGEGQIWVIQNIKKGV